MTYDDPNMQSTVDISISIQNHFSLFQGLYKLDSSYYEIHFLFDAFSLFMWAFDRWSPYSYQNNREKYKDDEEKKEFSLKECMWFCITSLTPQVNLSVTASNRP